MDRPLAKTAEVIADRAKTLRPRRVLETAAGTGVVTEALARILPPEVFADASPLFDDMGEHALGEMRALAQHAETHPPVHVPIDAWVMPERTSR